MGSCQNNRIYGVGAPGWGAPATRPPQQGLRLALAHYFQRAFALIRREAHNINQPFG
jgi:hypothetical protein